MYAGFPGLLYARETLLVSIQAFGWKLSNLPAKLIEITAGANPMKRIAKPKDVANVIKFLVSDEAEYLNGVNIPVNGGNIFS